MSSELGSAAFDQLFLEARTHNSWKDQEVSDELLQKIWDVARWGPTSMNCCPARIVFVKSDEAKAKLKECLSPGNFDKTMSAPVCAIIAMDEEFYTNMPVLFPSFPGAADMFRESPDLANATMTRNSTLQGGYLIMAARAFGLDCGPMSGFDNAKVDEAFFTGTNFKSNFLCNLGYGDDAGLYPRGPRPAFDEVCTIE